ncbi:MAG: hypothetical protein AB8B57_06300 [Congregibacter sp.]
MTQGRQCLCVLILAMLAARGGFAQEMPAHGNMEHGDHVSKFGGLVLMYGLRHFEIVANTDGFVALHLSDAMRKPMPAVTVSDVTVEVERQGGVFEYITMAVSETGDYWRGNGDPLDEVEGTTVHLAFIAFGAPYVYALPLEVLQAKDAPPFDIQAADTVSAPKRAEHAS